MILYRAYDVLMGSLRVRLVGKTFEEGRPTLFFFWHRNLFPLPHIFRNTPVKVMVSPSRDGRRIGELVLRKGLGVIWSSQYKSPVRGVVGVVRAIREGWNVAITPDGPRGPSRTFKESTFALYRRLGVRTVFVGVAYSSAYVLPSWDSFRVPMPFASVSVLLREAYPKTPEEATELLNLLDREAFNYLEV